MCFQTRFSSFSYTTTSIKACISITVILEEKTLHQGRKCVSQHLKLSLETRKRSRSWWLYNRTWGLRENKPPLFFRVPAFSSAFKGPDLLTASPLHCAAAPRSTGSTSSWALAMQWLIALCGNRSADSRYSSEVIWYDNVTHIVLIYYLTMALYPKKRGKKSCIP